MSSILLVQPLGVNWNPEEKDMSRVVNIMPPIGLLNLAAWVDTHGHSSQIYDCYAHPGDDRRLIETIRREKPDFLGVSATTSSFLDGVRIAEKAKEIHPDIRVVFGGVHVSGLREPLLRRFPVIDFGVVGEGEEALRALLDGTVPAEISGMLYRDGEEVCFTGFRQETLSMDDLPFPAYGKLDGYPERYTLPIFSYPKAPNTTIITSRGCPFQCSYCDRSVFRRTYRYNSAEYMMNLFSWLRDEWNIRHVNIYDDTFLLHRKRIETFCRLKIESGLNTTFNCAARSEQIDEEMLKLLKRAGCWMISLGMETGDPELLKRHRSYGTDRDPREALDEIERTSRLIKKAGIRVKGLFMMGLPGETEETIDRTMEFVFRLPLDDFNLSKLTPFPGAPMYSDIREHGTFDEKWELMNALTFVFIPNGLTKERLTERYHEFYRKYYSRPKTLLKYATMAWKSPDSWLRFLKDLPTFLSFAKDYKE